MQTTAAEALGQHRDELEQALRDAVGTTHLPLEAASRYVMGWEDEHGRPCDAGGKRIRPALCIQAALAFGGTLSDALPGAVAVELVHNFSLVHDEVQDHDAERHHRPTLWALLGEAQAINAGDFLYARAIRALISGTAPLDRRMAALDVLTSAITSMIDGQWHDIAFESREAVSVDDYLSMVAGKTGALLSAPLRIGALLAGAPAADAQRIGEWGARVGAAFQAHDDYLGIWGDPGETGKSNTNDIARRKKSLPVVHALGNADAATTVLRIYARPDISEGDIEAVVNALEDAGSAEYCRERARSQVEAADALLRDLPFEAETRERFEAIARFFVERRA
jgi:geranylgeranyl diphosphate synthase type I